MIAPRVVVLIGLAAACIAGCERERRDFRTSPSGAEAIRSLRMDEIAPGTSVTAPLPPGVQPEEDNAYLLAEGKRLFHWYNCSGCHAEGGGAIGPALMDDMWVYGSEPANIFATIVQGRPNGMPAFGGRIAEKEVWELVAYVRSLSGLVSQQAAPNRADAMQVKPPESEAKRQPPLEVSTPR
jgi:cytochrome c oxidase cbb3-type subunit 3